MVAMSWSWTWSEKVETLATMSMTSPAAGRFSLPRPKTKTPEKSTLVKSGEVAGTWRKIPSEPEAETTTPESLTVWPTAMRSCLMS